MRLPEQRLWDTMGRQRTKSLRNLVRNLFTQRIENYVGIGTPDVYYKPRDFTDCWVELKAPLLAKKQSTRLFRGASSLNPDQVNWALDYTKQHGRWYLVARDSDKELYMFNRPFILEINKMSVGDARVMRIADNWSDIYRIIQGGYFETET